MAPKPHAVDDAAVSRHAASETTPLLAGQLAPDGDTEASTLMADPIPQQESATADGTEAEDRPLPKFQLFVMCYARITEPIAFFSIFPFIAKMVARNGNLASTDVGFYSGLIESLFSAVQMCVLVAWGRLADRVGRKPVMMYSLIGMSFTPVLFGVSTSIPQMILFRCMAGVFSGSGLIIRTMIAEVSTQRTQARAYSYFAFAGNVGIFLGPLIGGALADPNEQYPGVFRNNKFFAAYPYFLSGLVPGLMAASATILSGLFLHETLDKEKKDTKPSNGTTTTTANSSGSNGTVSRSSDDEASMSMWKIVKSPGVAPALFAYSHVMLLAFAFTAVVPIALYTKIPDGGLGFSTFGITVFMAVQGASQGLWLILVFPWFQGRAGTKGVIWTCAVFYPWFFMGYVMLNVFLRNGSQAALVWFWIVGGLVALVGPGVSMAFTATQLSLNDSAPSTRVLGTLNALAMTISSGIRSVVPAVSTVVYAVGVRNQILAGQLIWVIMVPLAAVLIFVIRWLPDDKPRAPANRV